MGDGKKFLSVPFTGSALKGQQPQAGAEQQDEQRLDGSSHGSEKDEKKQTKKAKKTNGSSANLQDLDLQHTRTALEVAEMTEEDMIADYNAPIHMWVVSTLFPLIAGTFGPMASMFNVCAISTDWRIVVNPASEADGRTITDPSWLIAVNVISLAIAIVANLSLLGQMTDRIRYNISGPITIAGFFISGAVDIILVAVASQILPLDDGPREIYSQAFYYACFSGAIYVILAFMLSVTAWGIWFGHYSTEFKLSLSQRSLMLQTILFLAYILASAGVYTKLEGWLYLDSVYFVTVTLFTIGFGDYVPTTHLARSLFFPFAVGGILFVGVIIANIRTVILESGAVKVSTRLVEKARYKAIKAGKPEDGIFRVRGIQGVHKRDINDTSEWRRRRNEFHLMREIQREAHVYNRLVSLAISLTAFMILWFVGAVAFWKAESLSVGGQPWTYFDSLYFTFVAQLTIGYGDFEPQDDSSKPAFVFWALIALPTLTVLIGSVGDAVSAVVNWYTTWIGEHATALYDIFVALYQPNNRARDKIRDLIKNPNANKDEEDQQNDEDLHEIAPVNDHLTIPIGFDTRPFTEWQIERAEEKFRPYITVKAMQKILEHMSEDPPKKYSFKEWAWILKLLGDDESVDAGHRRIGHPLPDGHEIVEPIRDHHLQMWSWIGQESPLMSLEAGNEPKWMLKKLMLLLEKELKERSERHVERELGPGVVNKVEEIIDDTFEPSKALQDHTSEESSEKPEA